jgi:hypothetical protein
MLRDCSKWFASGYHPKRSNFKSLEESQLYFISEEAARYRLEGGVEAVSVSDETVGNPTI